MIKALIFDFDGVLVSSEGPRSLALQKLLTSHGLKYPDQIKKQAVGRTTLSILEQLLPNDPELIHKIIQEYKTNYVQNITEFVEPIEFTVNFIRTYNGNLPIAIASMSSLDAIEQLTKHFGIFEKIKIIVARDHVLHHKPHPEIYLKTADKLGVNPKNCVVFEDTAIGAQAGISAGMECYIILNGSNKKEDLKAMPIKSFISNESELQKVLAI